MPRAGPIRCLSFFFSSRRRHTICLSDWSSDVCSSDLKWASKEFFLSIRCLASPPGAYWRRSQRYRVRSEERRVGKECRSWWSWYRDRENSSHRRRVIELRYSASQVGTRVEVLGQAWPG